MNKLLTNLVIISFVALAVAGCASSERFTLDTDFDSSPIKTKTKLTEALSCLSGELEKNLLNPGAYVFMVRDIVDGTVNSDYADGPLADAGRIQMISILTAHTKPSYGLVTDRFPLLFEQTSNEQVGINRFGLPSKENLNAYVSMLTSFANANRQSKGRPIVNAVLPLVIDGAFTRYDSSHLRSKGYGQNAGYRGSTEDEQSTSADVGKSGSERSITLVVNIIDPKTNVIVGTEGFDLKFYSNSKTARFRVAIDDYYYGFSNTDVKVETVHAAQQTLLEAGAIWILDNAFGSMVDFSTCFDTEEKLALGRDSRHQRAKILPASAVQALGGSIPTPVAAPALAPALTLTPAVIPTPVAVAVAAPAPAPAPVPVLAPAPVPVQVLAPVLAPPPVPEPTASVPATSSQYKVRLSPTRESLSTIAGYDFIYGDSSQWPRLYQANIDKFKESANPDLIYPGQIINVPPINQPKAVTDVGPHWQVVVGIFAKSKNVVSVSEQLSLAGYQANYKIVSSQSGKATQVWLGPFNQKEDAKRISASLKKITGEKGFLIKYDY